MICHTWTVDNEENMEKMVKLNLDNLITDDPVKAREIVYGADTNSALMRMLKEVFSAD